MPQRLVEEKFDAEEIQETAALSVAGGGALAAARVASGTRGIEIAALDFASCHSLPKSSVATTPN